MVDKVWLPQRWDVGLWDQAVWDGQLGFNAALGAVRLNAGSVSFTLGHRLTAQTGSIVVTSYPIGLLSGRSFKADTGSIVVAGNPAGVVFSVHHFLSCAQGQIKVNEVAGQITLTAFLQPGPMNFGIPRVVIPNRW
jgi:hypothetical protein